MPSWNDGETSSGSLLSGFTEGGDVSPRSLVPATVFDSDYTGMAGGQLRCKHGLELHKFVAFEGANTGRKFLGCGLEHREKCDIVYWVDGEWPSSMKHALVRLWMNYEDERDTRLTENVEYSTRNYQLVLEKTELENKNTELHKQLGNTLSLEQVAKVSSQELELEKALRQKAEHKITTLKEKLKKISHICRE